MNARTMLPLLLVLWLPHAALAAAPCAGLPTHAQLKAALMAARAQDNGGFSLGMWATVVNRTGEVCAVAFTGKNAGAQWPGSRVISAQKANTANAFGLPGLALATANLYSAVQPGGSLFGLQESNPVDTHVAYAGPATAWGQPTDPMVGQRIGGVNVFGGTRGGTSGCTTRSRMRSCSSSRSCAASTLGLTLSSSRCSSE